MARLEDLATELILNILDLIPPEDLESVSLVSKRVHRASQPLLDEHREVLEDQYRVWDRYLLKDNYPSHEHRDTHADLLCTISSDQRLAKMVQTLRVRNDTWFDHIDDRGKRRLDETFLGALPDLRQSRHQASKRTRIQILDEVVRQNDMISESEKEVWINRVRTRSEGTAVLLLLCKLPALQNFQIDLSADESLQHPLLRMFDKILDRLTVPPQVATPVAQPCQNLKHIMITFDETEFSTFDLIRSFLSLPSISSLSCRSLVMNPEDALAIPEGMLHPSGVKQLRFDACILNPEALEEILSNVTNLENFTYAYYLGDDSPLLGIMEDFGDPGPNVHTALPIIAGTIGSSLETLVLSTKIEGMDVSQLEIAIQQIDLSQDFGALKRLSVSTNLLLSENGGNISNVASKLPTSLECLLLHWVKRAPVEDISALKEVLDNITEQAKAQLPLLEGLAVRNIWDKEDIEKLCPNYKRDGWHSFGDLKLCVQHNCECTEWDTILCSDIDWRYLVGDPNPGTYKSFPPSIAGSDDEN